MYFLNANPMTMTYCKGLTYLPLVAVLRHSSETGSAFAFALRSWCTFYNDGTSISSFLKKFINLQPSLHDQLFVLRSSSLVVINSFPAKSFC